MYDLCGEDLTKERLHSALILMGKRQLLPEFRKSWTPENPTKNYCYVVANFVFHYLAPEGSQAYSLKGIPGDDGVHHFVKWPDGEIVDLAVDQFNNFGQIDYSKAEPVGNFPLRSRAKILASLLGFDSPNKGKGMSSIDTKELKLFKGASRVASRYLRSR